MLKTDVEVLRSIVSPVFLEWLIKTNYSFCRESKVSVLSIGDNDHYLVESKSNSYVLRVYRYNKHWLHNEDSYLFEIDLLLFLKQNGISVSYPLPMDNSSYIDKIQAPEGQRYFILFSKATGKIMVFDEDSFYHYGAMISKFHSVSNHFKSQYQKTPIDVKFLIDLPVKRINTAFYSIYKNAVDSLNVLAEDLRSKINDFHANILSDEYGIIGGDFHGGNHFHELNNTQKITLFDFDLCGYGWRVYDIAVLKWELFVENTIHEIPNRISLWKAFLNGYNSNRALNNQELNMINIFIQVRQIWMIGSKLTYPDIGLNEYYFNKMFEQLKIAQEQ